jgi:hypothetical protein
MPTWDRIVDWAVILTLLAAILMLILLFRRTRLYHEIVCEIVPAVPFASIQPRRWRVAVFVMLCLGLVYASLFTGWRKRSHRARSH